MTNLAGALDISQKKKKSRSFFSPPVGKQRIHPLIKARGAQGVERVLGNLFTFSNAHLIRQDRSKISSYPPPGSRGGRNALNPLQYGGDVGGGGPRATEPTGPDESLPSRPHAQSKGSAICSLLIPRQATYHLDLADPAVPPPRSFSVLLYSTPSFLSADSSRCSPCFIRDGRKGVLTFHFPPALEYGFIPVLAQTKTRTVTSHRPLKVSRD